MRPGPAILIDIRAAFFEKFIERLMYRRKINWFPLVKVRRLQIICTRKVQKRRSGDEAGTIGRVVRSFGCILIADTISGMC